LSEKRVQVLTDVMSLAAQRPNPPIRIRLENELKSSPFLEGVGLAFSNRIAIKKG
jgi:hypothetical protein